MARRQLAFQLRKRGKDARRIVVARYRDPLFGRRWELGSRMGNWVGNRAAG